MLIRCGRINLGILSKNVAVLVKKEKRKMVKFDKCKLKYKRCRIWFKA